MVTNSSTQIKPIMWMNQHQAALDAQKHPDNSTSFSIPQFLQGIHFGDRCSLKGLGAVLSQKGKNGKTRGIAYTRRMLRLSERLMHDYSSALLELLALKWAVTEKLYDYIAGLKFTVYTDNNPLEYIKSSKLDALQKNWCSELALFDFDIQYWWGKTNKAVDALSQHPCNIYTSSESGTDSNVVDTILWSV